MELMEHILWDDNVVKALEYMEKKKKDTAPGIDGMWVPELREYLRANWREIKTSLLKGTYEPQPVRRTEIPKDGGRVRLLGIPTVLDRFIQQAMLQKLDWRFDEEFSASSHGFRKRHSQKMAVNEAREYIQSGNHWVVDMDLSKFFDRVNHDILMSRVARKIKDKKVLKLIRRYLEAGVMENGVVVETHQGTPQGGVISPLLSNVMLNDLDQELERRGHKFVRYADDFQVFVKSKRAGQRVMRSLTRFLEDELHLKVNERKSAVDWAWKRTFLGFSFYKRKGEVRIRLASKTLKKFKERIREETSRKVSISLEERIKNLNQYLKGWIGYFYIADMKSHLKKMRSWIRRRLRMCIWKQWKNVSTRIRNLKNLGLKKVEAIKFGNSRKGYWRLSKSYQMHSTLDNKFWSDNELVNPVEVYLEHR